MNFFFSKADRADFVEYCLNIGYTIIPDLDYVDNSYSIITSVEHYNEYMDECPRFFIVHNNYKKYPLEMDSFEKSGTLHYYIKQRYGGPAIDFSSAIIAEKNKNKIGIGLISIYPTYYHYNEKFIPDEKLKQAYKSLTSYIRKRAIRVKIGQRIYWVGRYSINQVKSGVLSFIEMDSFNWNTILK